jgi:hypothetical protein
MDNHRRHELLYAEFQNDPAAFLRRFVKALKAAPGQHRPSMMALNEMIGFIVETESLRQSDSERDDPAVPDEPNFLLHDRNSISC